MSGLQAFELAIDQFIDSDVPELVADTQRLITLQVLRGVVLRTPVDTGRARSNWQVSLEQPIFGILNAYAPGSHLGRKEVGNLTASIGAADDLVRSVKPYSVSFVQNNLPYIEALESGHSKQTPTGMVAVTIAEIEGQFS